MQLMISIHERAHLSLKQGLLCHYQAKPCTTLISLEQGPTREALLSSWPKSFIL